MDHGTADAATPETAGARPPIWEDFIDIFYAPGAVFERRADARFLPALVFVTLVTVIVFFGAQNALGDVFRVEMMRAIQAQGQGATPEQLEQMSRMSGIFGVLGFAVAFPIGIVLLGLVVWVAGKLVGAALTVGTALVISTYSQFPRIVQQLVNMVQGLVLDTSAMDSQHDVALGPARLLDQAAADPVIVGLATRADLFVLWVTVLIAIGLVRLGRVPAGRAALGAVLVWAVATVPAVVGAALAG